MSSRPPPRPRPLGGAAAAAWVPGRGAGPGGRRAPRLPEAWAGRPGRGPPFLAAAAGGVQRPLRPRAQTPAWPGPAPQTSVCCLKINLSVQNKVKQTKMTKVLKVCVCVSLRFCLLCSAAAIICAFVLRQPPLQALCPGQHPCPCVTCTSSGAHLGPDPAGASALSRDVFTGCWWGCRRWGPGDGKGRQGARRARSVPRSLLGAALSDSI